MEDLSHGGTHATVGHSCHVGQVRLGVQDTGVATSWRHVEAQADIRCRTEFWSQEKRKQEAFHSTHPALFAFIPGQPWNSVIRASASHSEFWSREFEKPAMLYVMN